MNNEKLNVWFGLSYASFLTLPRVFMQEMPVEWQDKMADLLNEYDDVFVNQPDIGTRVQCTDNRGKLISTPEWMINYRHPNRESLKEFKTVKELPYCTCKPCNREHPFENCRTCGKDNIPL